MQARITAVAILVVLTAWVYAPVLDYDFVAIDDGEYVAQNPHVQQGLRLESVRWALGSEHGGNWHPLTGLSHMLDVELFGLDARGHHATSALLHVLNALLLFGVLVGMTGSTARSAWVAAVFAIHPLHVESVAWISERKDVLSTFFALLALLAYLGFARAGGRLRQGMVAVLYACSLLAKPMLVTLPCLLLLLDLWPLGRIAATASGAASSPGGWQTRLAALGRAERPGRFRVSTPARLLREKLVLFALAAAISLMTLVVQSGAGAMVVGASIPIESRIANAVVSSVGYVAHTLWPADLAILVPHPYLPEEGGLPPSGLWIAVCSLGLVGASLLALRLGRSALVGWLWFLGLLVPVIGLIQVGPQGMADRYTYFPGIGLSVAIAFGIPGRTGRPWRRRLLAVAAVSVVIALTAACVLQVRHWRSSAALFRHALTVDPRSLAAHYALASLYRRDGELDLALAHYDEALAYAPRSPRALNGVGVVLRMQGRLEESRRVLLQALAAGPSIFLVRQNLGRVEHELGNVEAAEHQLQAAIRLEPSAHQARLQLAELLRELGRDEEAIEQLRVSVALRPSSRRARAALASLAFARGDYAESIAQDRAILARDPGDRRSRRRLARALERQAGGGG